MVSNSKDSPISTDGNTANAQSEVSKNHELLAENRQLRIELESARAEVYSSRAEQIRRGAQKRDRKPADTFVIWVSETELPEYIPYSLKDIRRMRKDGILKFYPDLRAKNLRVLYNLHEVTSQIRAGQPKQPSNLIQFDQDNLEIAI